MRGMAVRGTAFAVMVGVVLVGCAVRRPSKVTYVDPVMDFSLIQTVAVMPFQNLTQQAAGAPRVRDVFTTMLQATGAAYVLPPGEVARGVSRASVSDPGAPSAEEVVEFARIVGADVVITGTLREYGEVRSGSTVANVISLSLVMMEGQTGRVVWSASSTKGGVDAADRLFGGGGQPMNDVTEQAVDELIDRMLGR